MEREGQSQNQVIKKFWTAIKKYSIKKIDQSGRRKVGQLDGVSRGDLLEEVTFGV